MRLLPCVNGSVCSTGNAFKSARHPALTAPEWVWPSTRAQTAIIEHLLLSLFLVLLLNCWLFCHFTYIRELPASSWLPSAQIFIVFNNVLRHVFSILCSRYAQSPQAQLQFLSLRPAFLTGKGLYIPRNQTRRGGPTFPRATRCGHWGNGSLWSS